MKDNIRFVLTITILILITSACQGMDGEGTPEAESDVGVILSDDFSSKRWGTGTDSASSIEYLNESLQMIVYEGNHFVWSQPGDEIYENIHMEVTVFTNDTDPTTAFGLICNKSEGDDFYYFAVTPVGQYAIGKAEAGKQDVFLTNNDAWADSSRIPVNAPSYRIGADCDNGRLALFVDGQTIASVADSSYSNGRIALLVWSGEDAGLTTNVFFDDFLMMKLP